MVGGVIGAMFSFLGNNGNGNDWGQPASSVGIPCFCSALLLLKVTDSSQ